MSNSFIEMSSSRNNKLSTSTRKNYRRSGSVMSKGSLKVHELVSSRLKKFYNHTKNKKNVDNKISSVPHEKVHLLLRISPEKLSKIDSYVQKVNLMNAFFAICSVICTIILMESNMENGEYSKEKAVGFTSEMAKLMTSVCTFGIQIGLFLYYRKEIELDRYMYGIIHETIFTSPKRIIYLLEVLINLIHAPPFISQLHGIDVVNIDKTSIFTLIRLYLLARVYRDSSKLYQWRRWAILYIHELHPNLNISALSFDTVIILKHVYHRRPWFFL